MSALGPLKRPPFDTEAPVREQEGLPRVVEIECIADTTNERHALPGHPVAVARRGKASGCRSRGREDGVLKKLSITGDGTLCSCAQEVQIDRFGSTRGSGRRGTSEFAGQVLFRVLRSETQATLHPPMLVPQMRSNMSHAGFPVRLSILRMIVEIVYPFVPPPSMHRMRSGRGPSNAPSSRGIPPARWRIRFRHAIAATRAPTAADRKLALASARLAAANGLPGTT